MYGNGILPIPGRSFVLIRDGEVIDTTSGHTQSAIATANTPGIDTKF